MTTAPERLAAVAGSWLRYRLASTWAGTAVLLMPMILLGTFISFMIRHPIDRAPRPFALLVAVVGAWRAGSASRFLHEERSTGLLSQMMFSPGSTRGVARAEMTKEAIELMAIALCLLVGSGLGFSLDRYAGGFFADGLPGLAVDVAMAVFASGATAGLAAALALIADPVAAFGTACAGLFLVVRAHAYFTPSTSRPDLVLEWFTLLAIAAVLSAMVIEHLLENDGWRLRCCRR